MKAKIVPASSLLLALLLLQAVTVLPWHGDLVVWFEQALRPSKDLAVLLVLVLLGAAAGFRRTSAWLAGFVLWLLALLGPAMALHSLVFQRQFELADVLQFPGLIHLLLSRWPVVCQVLAMAGVVSIWPLLALAFLRIASLARSRNTRFASLGVPAAVALATWLGLPIAWQPSTAIGAVGMVTLPTTIGPTQNASTTRSGRGSTRASRACRRPRPNSPGCAESTCTCW